MGRYQSFHLITDGCKKIFLKIFKYFLAMYQMNSTSQVSRDDLLECVISRRQGSENLQTAVVPMWVVYQFLVSVVLLRILIVMMTITYKKIYDNLDTQWK